MGSSDEAGLERELRKLRKRRWGEAKIARWIDQKHSVEAREERIHPPPPWSDETMAGAEEKLFAPYGDRFDHFDRKTALAIIDDAERLGLVIQPSFLAYEDDHSITERVGDVDWDWWDKISHEAYERGGKAAAVSETAEAMRNFIRDGFPDDSNVLSFFVYR